jgi:hypothetical protein
MTMAKFIMEIVFWVLACSRYWAGTCLRNTKTPRKSQIRGQAMTQKRAILLVILSFMPFKKVAETWFNYLPPLPAFL